MLQTLRKRLERDEDGFTLIELMVVVLIIAILLAIAIPTFLGARERANDRAAQSSLRNAHTAAKTIYTDKQDYTAATDLELAKVEPSLKFEPAATASTGYKIVSVNPASATTWSGAALSKSGKCFWIKEVATGTGAGTFYGGDPSGAACKGSDAAAAAGAEF